MADGAAAGAQKAATSDDATRGRPYYESLRRQLKADLERKRMLDTELAQIEDDLANQENEYLEATSAAGNIIKGFDNYIKAASSTSATTSGPGTATRRKGGISDQDRIFSRSSVSWNLPDNTMPLNGTAKGPGKLQDGLAFPPSHPHSGAGSARDTPSSTGGGATTKTGNKNKKKGAVDKGKDGDDGDGERPAKRGKVSFHRD